MTFEFHVSRRPPQSAQRFGTDKDKKLCEKNLCPSKSLGGNFSLVESHLRSRFEGLVQRVERGFAFRPCQYQTRWADAFVAGFGFLLHEFDELHELDDRVH